MTWLPKYVPRLVKEMSQLANIMVDMFWGSVGVLSTVGLQCGKIQEAERGKQKGMLKRGDFRNSSHLFVRGGCWCW